MSTPFIRTLLAATLAAASLATLPGCSVTRGQSTVGEYIDDATITTRVKARMVENKQVALGVKGVKSVRNEIAVRSAG